MDKVFKLYILLDVKEESPSFFSSHFGPCWFQLKMIHIPKKHFGVAKYASLQGDCLRVLEQKSIC